MKNIYFEAALRYAEMGYSVIPVIAGQKKPAIEWKEFQTRKATPQEIESWWLRWPSSNVGIVTGAISDLNVIDLDRYKEGYNEEIELKYFPDTFVTPTALTPRGGTHLYTKANNMTFSGKADVFPGIDIRSEGNFIVAPPSKNGAGKPYHWVDGLELGGAPLALFPEGFYKALKEKDTVYNNKYLNSFNVRENIFSEDHNLSQVSQNITNVTNGHKIGRNFYTLGRRDEDIFHLANVLVKQKCDPEFIDQTLKMVAYSCNPRFSEKEAETKILSALKRAKDRSRNIMQDAREFVDISQSGHINITEASQFAQVVTKEQKHALRMAFIRLEKEGIIKRVGKRSGQYEIIDKSEELIDYKNIDMTPYDVRMPMQIEKWVEVNKGNIVVIAGESNAGKTAFLLNVAQMNSIGGRKVNYMSSEMHDGVELRKRLDKFHVPLDSWDSVKFQFRVDGFPDKIEPDGLNIIDYLDEGSDQDATRMPSRLRDIANALKTGVAFVAIQKHPGKDFGYGGAGTLNRARVYITITRENILTIVKAKIWANENVNPNGSFCKFKLGGGCTFKIDSDWNFTQRRS